ncbi:glycosyltransferase family 2 protein [Mariniflexile soesokkakense]|uniref:Glycosyltransferase family 2 protein n=1 Tax=Mariniflexile soesokkakense TaxID=1343160 RepID=A0ABV0A699_9FLAO
MAKLPLVSICIPTFNGEKYIAETMNSAIQQTYPNLEIIVSDDASNDDTLSIIESYISKTRIPVKIYNHAPKGIGANWNYCIDKANGEYIKFLFQDDLLEPTCIDKMMKVLETDNSIKIVLSKRNILVDESFKSNKTKQWIEMYGDLQSNLNLKSENGISIIDKKIFKLSAFLIEPLNKFGEPSVILFKKDLIKEIGKFREDLIQILDFEFCNRALLKYKAALINEKLVTFRLHLEQTTNKNEGKISDLQKFDVIVYNQYFWLLNNKTKMKLLKKHSFIMKILVTIKRKLFL